MSTQGVEQARQGTRGIAVALVVAAMAAASVTLWTGIPIAWMLIASWLSSVGYVHYLIALGGCVVSMAGWGWGLGWLNRIYLQLRGRPPDGRRDTALLDAMVVVSAVLALAAFLVWYFGFSDTPSGTPWPDETSGAGP